MFRVLTRRVSSLVVSLALLFPAAAGAAARTVDSAEIQLALRKLTVLGSAMYVAAHPDDENTAMLSYLSSDRLVRTAYLAMTRGDGGQNLIGSEKGPLLGVLRTQELLAARRVDGAEQYFTRALDFGFSKGPQETFEIWGHDAILEDVVWNIRRFQPDVMITRFPTTGEGGHGHHTASAILAVEAFTAAADPSRFPGQLKFVNVWQTRRLYWNLFRPPGATIDTSKLLKIDVGAFNRLLGRSYTEIAAESRSQHKSQGFGSSERRGGLINYLSPLAGEPAASDPFEGVDMSWSRYAGGAAVGKILDEASQKFDPRNPAASIPLLLEANREMDRLGASPAWSAHTNPWLEVKRKELLNVIRACAGLSIDVTAATPYVTAGGDVNVTATVVNRSDFPLRLEAVGSPYANPSKAVAEPLRNNEPVKVEVTIHLPDDYPSTQPYWLRKPPEAGRYVVEDQEMLGLPENPPPFPLVVTIGAGVDQSLFYNVPVVYRWTDPVQGQLSRPLDIVPPGTIDADEHIFLFPDSKPRSVGFRVGRLAGATSGTARLRVPEGWKISPDSLPVAFGPAGNDARVEFTVTPPATETTGTIETVVTTADGKTYTEGMTTIEYPHIPAQRVFSDARFLSVRIDLHHKGSRIGYIMGPGDDVPEALRQAGYSVTLLTDEDLERGELTRYDAIVAGIRSYNTRRVLKTAHARLMHYVEEGGTMVVQYQTMNDDITVASPGPYPFTISTDRVTVEGAPVHLLAPDDPLLTTPNRITAADFGGWVQERGLSFASKWDPRYRTILESHDPGESEKPGGMLVAHYGKGIYIYTGYAWFRQLPAGVPGAYKLFMNLVSAKKE
jgi:LmbE family N-acetylglucosaminyl deacetylase